MEICTIFFLHVYALPSSHRLMDKHVSLSEADLARIMKKADALSLSFSAFVRVACYAYKIENEIPHGGERHGQR